MNNDQLFPHHKSAEALGVVDAEQKKKALGLFVALLDGTWKKHGQSLTFVFERACQEAHDAGLDLNIPWVDTQGKRILERARILRDWVRRPDCPTWKRSELANALHDPGRKWRPSY